ncbi:MAG: M24 family metallopeptidase [Candidatus Omnitrophota bacterium]
MADRSCVKTAREIAMLKRAARIAKDIYREIEGMVVPGITERQVSAGIDGLIKDKGLGRAFRTIVASGPNAAKPHAAVTDRRIGKRDLVVIDFGVVFRGYRSDMTRTKVIGRVAGRARRLYDSVRKAQEYGITLIRSGAKISDVVSGVHGRLRKDGLGRYIKHSLGHGIGKKIHEAPRLSESNRKAFMRNSVVTVEPGLYVDGYAGVRIEDMVIVKDNGCEVLTR